MKKQNTKGLSIEIPYKFQQIFVGTLVITSLFEIGLYLYMSLSNNSGVEFKYMLNQIIFMLFPFMLFIVSYIFTSRQKTQVGRFFMAALKAILAIAVYGVISMLLNITIRFNFNGGVEPGFWQSSSVDYIVMAAVALGLIVVHLIRSK